MKWKPNTCCSFAAAFCGDCRDLWMRTSVSIGPVLFHQCIFLRVALLWVFFSLFQMRAKPTCSDFFSIVWILSPQKGMWCAPSCSSSHVLLMFSFNFPLLEFRAIIFVVFQVGTGSCFLFAAALAHLSGNSFEHLGVTFCLPPQFTPSVFASIHRTHQTTAVGV